MNPVYHAILFVAAQIVVGILAYRQGRQDEELRWRRFVTRAQIVGFEEKELGRSWWSR